jgi:hypothetical protein
VLDCNSGTKQRESMTCRDDLGHACAASAQSKDVESKMGRAREHLDVLQHHVSRGLQSSRCGGETNDKALEPGQLCASGSDAWTSSRCWSTGAARRILGKSGKW